MKYKVILISVVLSICFSYFIYLKYDRVEENYTKIYLLQVGAYKDYSNVANITKNYENYIVLKDDELYKVVIGVTSSDEVYKKLETLYLPSTQSTYKKELKITNQKLEEKIKEYDDIISKTTDIKSINLVVKASLKEVNDFLNEKGI